MPDTLGKIINQGEKTMSTAIAERVEPSAVLTPMDMLERAVSQGANIDTLTKLMDLQERWEKGQARKAFDGAMAEAKAEIPVITKNREVDFTSSKGRTNYRHEDLAGIARTVDPILTEHGLSYRFRTTSALNEPVSVTCIVSHRDGHSEENTLSAGRDDSGNKNSIQAVGSTITYLQRYTLKAALGLAASDDDDGKGSEDAGTISPDQVEQLRQAIVDTGSDLPRFLKKFTIDTLPEMKLSQFGEAMMLLDQKAKQGIGS